MRFHQLIGTPRLRDGRTAAPCRMMVFDSRDFHLVRFTMTFKHLHYVLEPTRKWHSHGLYFEESMCWRV
jgi:hypothetical protein